VIEIELKDLTEAVAVMLEQAAALSKLTLMKLIGERQLQIGRRIIARAALQIRCSPLAVEAILKKTAVAAAMIR
jgi:hypothetical protein